MPQAGFTTLDWIVLAAYFVGIVLFGLWISRRIKTSGSYFLGERKLGWWIMVGQSFGTGTHAEQPVAQVGATFQYGFATIWYQWKNMLITPFYWLQAPWFRRSERTTIGEIVEDRFGRKLGLFYSIYAIAFFVFNQGAMLKGGGKLIAEATQYVTPAGMAAPLTPNQVVLWMAGATLIYSFFGGLLASAYTNFVQSFLIIVLSFMLLPAGLHMVGGFAGMRQALPADFFDLYNQASKLDAFFIAMLTVNGLVGIVAQPHVLSMCATGNTERAGRVGQTYGAIVKRFCTIGWALTGLIVAAMIVQRGETLADKEFAFGYACRVLLAPGLTGLMVACVLAANMSTCSNFMVNTGALFATNIYQRYIRPQANDKEVLWTGRISGLLLTSLGIIFALYVEEVLQAFLFTETIAALVGVMIIGGFMWKRANRWGAWAATIAAFVVYWGLSYLTSCKPSAEAAPYLALGPAWQHLLEAWHSGQAGTYLSSGSFLLVNKWLPGPFGWSMLAGFGALIVASLLTRPEKPELIEAFFDNQNRSTDEEALPVGGQKPLARERGEDLLLLDVTGWFSRERWQGFWSRYREDIWGFIIAWGAVAVMVLTAWGIMQVGK